MNALAPMLLTSRTGEPLVLEGVNASGQLHDALLTMTIEQRYRNPGKKHIEAIYTFPLPWGAVLMAVEVDLGGKSLSGQVHARPQAEAKYEQALSEGDAAILLERNRDGSHTLNLGNFAPGEQCSIRIRYAQSMCVEQGSVRLKLPTVIAPRYGDALAGGLQSQQVPKVDWLAAYPLEVTVDIFGSLAATRVASPSHPISVGPLPCTGAGPGVRVSLSRQSWLDRDVVLLLGPVQHGSLGQALADPLTPGQTAVKLALKPRVPPRTTPLRLKVLVDCSGSMAGDSMESAREALQSIVSQLEGKERFSLSRFGSTVEHRSRALWAVTPATRQGAQRWVEQLDANLGGTEMEEALASTFALGLDSMDGAGGADGESAGDQADVLLVTDGQITAVADTVALAQSSGHRVFVVGLGTAANDQLIYALAEATGGACEFVAPGEAVAPAVLRMFHRLRGGHVKDLQLQWPGDAVPLWQQALPKSVFDGDTVHIHALFDAPVSGPLAFFVHLQPHSAPTVLAELTLLPQTQASETEASTLARMVAWAQINDWTHATHNGLSKIRLPSSTALRQRIAKVAVAYQLVTDESCFVLVHERAEADKALDMPAPIRVSHMLAAGWAGTSSVNAPVAPDVLFSRTRSSSSSSSAHQVMEPAAMRYAPSKRYENRLPGQSGGFDDSDAFYASGHGMPRQAHRSAPSLMGWVRKLGQSLQRKSPPSSAGHGFEDMDDINAMEDLNHDLLADLRSALHSEEPRRSDRANAPLWASGVGYTGLTPLGLAQWLGQHSANQWPQDLEALADIGLGRAVLDWIEFVLAPRLGTAAATDADTNADTNTQAAAAVALLLRWLGSAPVLTYLKHSLNADLSAPPPPGELAAALSGITARVWPAQVFALEDWAAAPSATTAG